MLLVGVTMWLSPSHADAQPELPVQEFDRFFDQMLPPLTEQERERLAAIPISLREERQLGRQALELLLRDLRQKKIKIVRRGKDVQYLQSLIRTVQPQMKQARRYHDWEVCVVNSDITEARCFPGGYLVFFRGLLDCVESEAALVSVIAHELSHLDRGHALIQLRAWKQSEQAFTAGPRGDDMRELMGQGMMVARTLGRPFRPEDEAQADRDAVLWTFQAGYDPRELAELFHRLQRRVGKQPRWLPGFLRSHPFPEQRYRDTLQQARQLIAAQPQAECYVGRPNLKQRVPRDRKRFP
jgi:predicted Zn-dependent protease